MLLNVELFTYNTFLLETSICKCESEAKDGRCQSVRKEDLGNWWVKSKARHKLITALSSQLISTHQAASYGLKMCDFAFQGDSLSLKYFCE